MGLGNIAERAMEFVHGWFNKLNVAGAMSAILKPSIESFARKFQVYRPDFREKAESEYVWEDVLFDLFNMSWGKYW